MCLYYSTPSPFLVCSSNTPSLHGGNYGNYPGNLLTVMVDNKHHGNYNGNHPGNYHGNYGNYPGNYHGNYGNYPGNTLTIMVTTLVTMVTILVTR